MANKSLPNYQFGGPHTQDIPYSSECQTNLIEFVIPKRDSNGKCIKWEQKPMAPSSVKHLYSHIPLNYEQMLIDVPKGTLYDHEIHRTYFTGMGREKIIGGGHYKVWPLTNAHILENRDYSDTHFERPEWRWDRTVSEKPVAMNTDWTSQY